MKKCLHFGLWADMQKVPSGTCEMCWGFLSTKWVQVSATCIVQSGWQRALHCGVGYLCFLGVFPLEQKYQCSKICCRTGAERALPIGGCMDWIFKSSISSSRKFVSSWLCSHGVFEQELVFIQELVSLFKLLQHFTFFHETCLCLSGSTHFYMLVCHQALPEVFKDSVCAVIYVSMFWRQYLQYLHFHLFLSHKENYLDSEIIKWTATSVYELYRYSNVALCFIRIFHLICGQCQMWGVNFSLPWFRH